MFSTISRNVACARSTLVFNADSVWKTSDEFDLKRKNLEEWVRLNRLERLLKRTTVSDSFSLVVKSRSKTVRCIIPFRPLLVLGNYGYDECREYGYTAEVGVKECQDALDRALETSIEPWMLPEVEDAFISISKGFPAPAYFFQCCSRQVSESYPCCGQLYPFYKPIRIPYSAFDHEKQNNAHSGAHIHQLSSILEEAAKKAHKIREDLTEYRFRMLDFSSALKLVRYPQLLFPVISLDIPYEVKEVEIAADFSGKCYQHPICEDSLRKPVSDDDIERYPLPWFSINNQRERLLSYKIQSESVRDLWSNCSFKLMGNQKVRRINFFDKKVEISNWTSCVCKRCFPQQKRKRVKIKPSESKTGLLQAAKQSIPMNVRGLNVEVPEFFPRKEDYPLLGEQKYYPSLVPTSQISTVLYNQPQWFGNTYNPLHIPPSTAHVNYNAGTFGSPSVNYSQTQFNLTPELISQMARQCYLQNYSNMQPYPQQIAPNNFVPGPQMAIGWTQPSLPLNRVPQSTNYCTPPTCPMAFQQTWAPNSYLSQFQQPPSPQHAQLAFLYQSSQQFQNLQTQTKELTNLYQQRWQNETTNQNKQPMVETEIVQIVPRMQLPESAKIRHSSPPKNIPVFQRPPESYASVQGDFNNRRRHGTSGGGGGVVMSNLIVLTKASRCKDAKNKICFTEVEEQEDEGAKLVDCGNNGGSEDYNDINEKYIDSVPCSSKLSIVGSIPEVVPEAEDPAVKASEEIRTDIPKGAGVTVDSMGEEPSQDSCCNDLEFSKESMTITSPEMTSTPKKNKKKKKYKRDRYKWLDTSNSDIQNNTFRRPSSSHVSSTALLPVVQSELESKKKRELSHEFRVKTSYSDPSFPPIKTYHGNSRLPEESDGNSTPSPSWCQRKLYRDVLAPNVDFPSCQVVSAQSVGISMSADSLEVHYGELEKLAVEQYESSNDSLSRVYTNLEFEALEQYCCSCESFAKCVADTTKSHMDVNSGCEKRGDRLSVTRNISDEMFFSSDSTASHRQEGRVSSEQRRVVILMRAGSKKSYSKIANGNSSSDEERGPKENPVCSYHTHNKEIFTKQENFLQGNTEKDRNDQGKDIRKKAELSKGTVIEDASNADYIKNCETSENKNHKPVQQETPNEQRTQVSPTTGNKSVREKEDLADSVEVPEAWVQKHQEQGKVADDEIYDESIRCLFETGTMENDFEIRQDVEPIVGGRKRRRRRKKRRRKRKIVIAQCIDTSQGGKFDGVNEVYDNYSPKESEFENREDLSVTMADVSANDILVCEELLRVIKMEDIPNKCQEISSKQLEILKYGSKTVSTFTLDLQEAMSEPIVISTVAENDGLTGTGIKVIDSKDGIFLEELITTIDKDNEMITIYENVIPMTPQIEYPLTQKCSNEGRFSSEEIEKSGEMKEEKLSEVIVEERNDLVANQEFKRNNCPFNKTILNLDHNAELVNLSQSLELQPNLTRARHSLSAPSLHNEISIESLEKHSASLCSNSIPTMPRKPSPQSSTSSQSSNSSPVYNSGFYKLLGMSKKVDKTKNHKTRSVSKKQAPSCSLQ